MASSSSDPMPSKSKALLLLAGKPGGAGPEAGSTSPPGPGSGDLEATMQELGEALARKDWAAAAQAFTAAQSMTDTDDDSPEASES